MSSDGRARYLDSVGEEGVVAVHDQIDTEQHVAIDLLDVICNACKYQYWRTSNESRTVHRLELDFLL